MSGVSARKEWLATPDAAIHHLPFPRVRETAGSEIDWMSFLNQNLDRLAGAGIEADQICAVFVETLQGWGAVPLPAEYVQALRRWADANDALLIFDEVQTGFARTGRLFAHEHYGVRGDLICIGKGLSSTLPVAAVLGSHEVLDLIPPAEITTTHAAHPVSCAAALANLDVIRDENLVAEAERKGNIAAKELACLQERFPGHISGVAGFGLLRGIHVRNPDTGAADPGLARDWTWAGVKHGVMLFQVNRPSIKVVPPLVIEDAAIKEGVAALGDALASIV